MKCRLCERTIWQCDCSANSQTHWIDDSYSLYCPPPSHHALHHPAKPGDVTEEADGDE